MNGPKITRYDAIDEAVVAAGTDAEVQSEPTRWEARLEVERYRAETERLQVLVDFLTRPIHAHGGSEPDPDIVTAYNLAVEAALRGVRQAAPRHLVTRAV
jgi:hypothetical protein